MRYAAICVEVPVVISDHITRNSHELHGHLAERFTLVPERLRGRKVLFQKWLEVRIREKNILLTLHRVRLCVLPHPRKIFHLRLFVLQGSCACRPCTMVGSSTAAASWRVQRIIFFSKRTLNV